MVGLAIVSGFVVIGLIIVTLRGRLTDRGTTSFDVTFSDAGGISKGVVVQMAGVPIGSVEEVGLTPDNRARVRVRINRPYQVPRGSRFTVTNGLLGGNAIVKVDPAAATAGAASIGENEPGIVGTAGGGLDATLAAGRDTLDEGRGLIVGLQKIVNDPEAQADLKRTLRNIRATTDTLPALTRDVQVQLAQVGALARETNRLLAGVDPLLSSGARIARNIENLSGDVRAALNENRGTLRSLLRTTDETISAFAGLAEQVGATAGDPQLRQNLVTVTDNLAASSARLDAIAGNVERLSSDPRLSADIRAAVTNLRAVSESFQRISARVETIRIPGERRAPGGEGTPPPPPRRPTPTETFLEAGPTLDTVFDAGDSRLRVDANFTVLGREDSFYRAGVYDFSERNRLNLQIGRANVLGEGTALRYGLVAGKLGGGLDLRAGPADLRLEAYDPNRLSVDLRAKVGAGQASSVLLGVEALGKENRATIGVQIRR